MARQTPRQAVPMPEDHWLGEDGRTAYILIQGQLLVWRELLPKPHTPEPRTRGRVLGFSASSRLRLLKLLATIDWAAAEPALFITLTYPDEIRNTTNKEFNVQRYLFHRHIENYLSREIPVLWRLEWKQRKSGSRAGEFYPHFHLMVFNVRYIPYTVVNESWKKSLGWSKYVRTDTKGMVNARQAGFYVSKYCAKADSGSLVNAAYFNTIPYGRQWGVMRSTLLPRHERTRIRVRPELVQECRDLAEQLYPPHYGKARSFTLLGGNAIKVAARIIEKTAGQGRID